MKVIVKVLFIVIIFTSFLIAQVPWLDRLNSKSVRPPADYNPFPKKSGHYTAEDWVEIIDTTWGPGLPTDQKLALFNEAWNILDDNFAAFQNIDVEWQGIYDKYYDEINSGVSRGRFVAIMNHMALALQESHTWIWNSEVDATPLEPGIPMFYPCGNGDNTSRFGASLTPLPDSSLLVFKALPNHPLDLEPGDRVIGYDGIPWKILYKELLAAQLPIYWGWIFPVSDEQSLNHIYLTSAGMNWHLFDTLDVIKYGSSDTMHYPTSSLAGQTDFIWGNEQAPYPRCSMAL